MLSEQELKEIQAILGYEYRNINLLKTAFTHSSLANQTKIDSNERLEFLGDSLLNLVTTRFLFNNSSYNEGDMSKIRAYLVSSENLSKYIKQTNLISFLKTETFNPMENKNVMGDLFEAIVASMFMDSNYEVVNKFITTALNYSKKLIDETYYHTQDFKTKLQEIVQTNPNNKLEYVVLNKTGPAHRPLFEVGVVLNGQLIEKSSAYNKKEAENICAKKIIEEKLV